VIPSLAALAAMFETKVEMNSELLEKVSKSLISIREQLAAVVQEFPQAKMN
jgi:hypothetical protein